MARTIVSLTNRIIIVFAKKYLTALRSGDFETLFSLRDDIIKKYNKKLIRIYPEDKILEALTFELAQCTIKKTDLQLLYLLNEFVLKENYIVSSESREAEVTINSIYNAAIWCKTLQEFPHNGSDIRSLKHFHSAVGQITKSDKFHKKVISNYKYFSTKNLAELFEAVKPQFKEFSKNILKSKQAVTLNNKCQEYLDYLGNTVEHYLAKNHPKLLEEILKPYVVEELTDAITNKKFNEFKQGNIHRIEKYPMLKKFKNSQSLTLILKKYFAVRALQECFKKPGQLHVVQVREFKKLIADKEINNILRKNRDHACISFLKKVLAVISCGLTNSFWRPKSAMLLENLNQTITHYDAQPSASI